MAIFGFIMMVCYIPGVTGFALPSGWLVLSAALPWILRTELFRWPPLIILWAALGLLWTPVWQQGIYDLWKLLLLWAAFLLGQTRPDTTKLLHGLSLGLLVSSIIGTAQWLGYTPVETIYPTPSGLFFNPNVLGEIAALIAVACFAHGLWPLGLMALPPVVLSQSRTALLALAACGTVYLWRRSPTVFPILLLCGALAIPLAWIDKPLGHLSYRIAIWQNTIDGLTLWGRGPGSFISTYPAFASRTDVMATREEDAHNDFLQIAYQYGAPGVAFLLILALLVLCGPVAPERSILLALAVIAFFNFPLEIPCEAFLGAFALGRLSRHWRFPSHLWLGSRWPIGGRLALPQFGPRRGRREAIPMEPIHPH